MVLEAAHVSFRGATAATSRSTLAMASARTRGRSFDAWEQAARAAGFPTAGPDFVLGVTDRRVAVWRTSFGLSRPVALAGAVPLASVYDANAVRHGLVTGLAIVLGNGAIVEVEALRGRPLRALGRAIRDAKRVA